MQDPEGLRTEMEMPNSGLPTSHCGSLSRRAGRCRRPWLIPEELGGAARNWTTEANVLKEDGSGNCQHLPKDLGTTLATLALLGRTEPYGSRLTGLAQGQFRIGALVIETRIRGLMDDIAPTSSSALPGQFLDVALRTRFQLRNRRHHGPHQQAGPACQPEATDYVSVGPEHGIRRTSHR